MNKDLFLKEIDNLGIKYTEEQLDQLNTYYKFLKEYNEHTNLTTITNEEEVYLKHFYDSLTIIRDIDLNSITNILDIGTGAGFPGMVLKIFYPQLNIYLLDSNNKKLKFLEELSNNLNIKVNLVHERAEIFIKDKREYFDLVVSRAVANLRVLSELCIPYVKENNYFIALKSNIEEELKDSKEIIPLLGGKIEKIDEFNLPFEESKRTIVKIKKINKTNLKYPRSYEKIKKG